MNPSTLNNFLACSVLLILLLSAPLEAQEIADGQRSSHRALDRLALKSGTEIRGKILKPEIVEDGRKYILFRTENGGVLKLEMGKVVIRSYSADPVESEYHSKLDQLPDDTDSHWTMYQWLSRQKGGSVRYKNQREYHLRRIIELDPTDEKALNLLDFQNLDGQWIEKDLLHAYHGYVSEGGKWMPQLQQQVNQRAEERRQSEGDLNSELKRWQRYVLDKESPTVVEKKLRNIVQNDVRQLDRMMTGEKRPEVRKLFVDTIGRRSSTYAQSLLVKYAMMDSDDNVRERAISMLQQDRYNPQGTTNIIASYLKSPENRIVRRAGRLIGIIAADNGPFYLQQVLVTKHKMSTGNQSGRTQGSFSNTGELQSFGTGGGPTHKVVDVQNQEVLDALRTYSGRDFGFDVAAWKEWYIQNHVSTEDDLRRDN